MNAGLTIENAGTGPKFWILADPEVVELIYQRGFEIGWVIREQRQEGDLVRLLIQDPYAPAEVEGKTVSPTVSSESDGSMYVSNYGIPT